MYFNHIKYILIYLKLFKIDLLLSYYMCRFHSGTRHQFILINIATIKNIEVNNNYIISYINKL